MLDALYNVVYKLIYNAIAWLAWMVNTDWTGSVDGFLAYEHLKWWCNSRASEFANNAAPIVTYAIIILTVLWMAKFIISCIKEVKTETKTKVA